MFDRKVKINGFVVMEFVGDGFVFEPGTRLFHGVTGFDAVERVGHCVHWGYKSPQSLRLSMSVAGLCGNETVSATGVLALSLAAPMRSSAARAALDLKSTGYPSPYTRHSQSLPFPNTSTLDQQGR